MGFSGQQPQTFFDYITRAKSDVTTSTMINLGSSAYLGMPWCVLRSKEIMKSAPPNFKNFNENVRMVSRRSEF